MGALSLLGLCYSLNDYTSDIGQKELQAKKITRTGIHDTNLIELELLFY